MVECSNGSYDTVQFKTGYDSVKQSSTLWNSTVVLDSRVSENDVAHWVSVFLANGALVTVLLGNSKVGGKQLSRAFSKAVWKKSHGKARGSSARHIYSEQLNASSPLCGFVFRRDLAGSP